MKHVLLWPEVILRSQNSFDAKKQHVSSGEGVEIFRVPCSASKAEFMMPKLSFF
jgi:hypothetical protein